MAGQGEDELVCLCYSQAGDSGPDWSWPTPRSIKLAYKQTQRILEVLEVLKTLKILEIAKALKIIEELKILLILQDLEILETLVETLAKNMSPGDAGDLLSSVGKGRKCFRSLFQ